MSQEVEVVKQQPVVDAGLGDDPETKLSQSCCGCGKVVENIQQCSRCKASKYCSRKCQVDHWSKHKVLRSSISKLSSRKSEAPTMFRSHLSPSQHRNLVKLVGEKCEVKCQINKVETKSLLDSGSQVAGVSELWLSENCPDVEIRDVQELIGKELDLRTANQQPLPYKGWVELTYQLGSGPVVQVPFLVVGNEVKVPIVGFNVMKRLLDEMGPLEFIQEMVGALGVNEEEAKAAVKIIEAAENESLADVRSAKKSVVVGAGQMVKSRIGYSSLIPTR